MSNLSFLVSGVTTHQLAMRIVLREKTGSVLLFADTVRVSQLKGAGRWWFLHWASS